MPVLKAEFLMELTEKIFVASGATEEEAKCVAKHLVAANLAGHDSHGIMVIPEYLEMMEKGLIRPNVQPEILQENSTTAIIDGKWGFGQVVAEMAMELAINKAGESGLSIIGIRHVYHIGRLGFYSSMAAERGMIGVVLCNTGPIMAPYGGRSRVLGSNPISVAAPSEDGIFLLDFATSVVAGNKVVLAYKRGERIPRGWMLDKNGNPTDDPSTIFDEGALLPFGGHKGYAIALLIDILGGILTGHGCTSCPEFKHGNGTLMLAIKIENFIPLDEFKNKVKVLFKNIKNVPKAPGFTEILIPGEPERRTAAQRLKDGIPVSPETWKTIENIATKLKIKI